MMNFVFNGFSCKKDRVILSGYGGCNSCGELFKEFDFSGNEIKESSDSVDLKPMENIITGFSSLHFLLEENNTGNDFTVDPRFINARITSNADEKFGPPMNK